MTTSTAPGREGLHVRGGLARSWLSRVFALNPAGINWPRAVLFLDVALVPLVVFWAIGHEEYLLSALFGTLFVAVSDPGGSYGNRASRLAGFGSPAASREAKHVLSRVRV